MDGATETLGRMVRLKGRARPQVGMKRRKQTMTKWMKLCGVALAVGMSVLPAGAQEAAKKEPPKPAPGPAQALLEQWNDIGRKLVAIAEDLPEDKYDYKPNPDSRTF